MMAVAACRSTMASQLKKSVHEAKDFPFALKVKQRQHDELFCPASTPISDVQVGSQPNQDRSRRMAEGVKSLPDSNPDLDTRCVF